MFRPSGSRTLSITWMTPFDCLTSAIVTVATPPFSSVSVILSPILLGLQRAATDSLNRVAATVIGDHLGNGGRHGFGRHDVAGQHLGQLFLVLRLQQRVDGAGRQGIEGGIDRSEDRERTGAGQGLDQAGSLDGSDQRRVILGVDGILDNVLVFRHGGAADHGVFGVGGDGTGCERDGKRERAKGGLEHFGFLYPCVLDPSSAAELPSGRLFRSRYREHNKGRALVGGSFRHLTKNR